MEEEIKKLHEFFQTLQLNIDKKIEMLQVDKEDEDKEEEEEEEEEDEESSVEVEVPIKAVVTKAPIYTVNKNVRQNKTVLKAANC